MINGIRAYTNKAKSSSGNKKVFNGLNGLMNHINKKKTTRKSAIKKISGIISDLDQQRQKSTVLQNKIIDVVYHLFDAFGISTKSSRLVLPKWIKVTL